MQKKSTIAKSADAYTNQKSYNKTIPINMKKKPIAKPPISNIKQQNLHHKNSIKKSGRTSPTFRRYNRSIVHKQDSKMLERATKAR